MQRIFLTFLLWTLILCACSTRVASPQPIPPTATDAPLSFPTTVVPDPTLIATLSTPHIDQPPDGETTPAPPNPQDCGYQWANQDLPELSSSFQKSIQALQPEAQTNAYAFGENCMLADGSIGGFSAMETDFNITLQVNDLTNESELGEWIVKVMQVIENIPPDQIVGPQPGRVSMIFQSNGDQKIVNFYINQYQALPAGLSNSEIYQALQIPQ
ncbi:MAG TPA: hypothetical protein VF918_13500 [Anaerolineales bacterium]